MDPHKFIDKFHTADSKERAWVDFGKLKMLWFNTGTLCNLQCKNCYIESSPTNDQLVYLTAGDVEKYLQEIKAENFGTNCIGLTGGEPFLNPSIISIMELILSYNHHLLVLTNANRVMKKHQEALIRINKTYGQKLSLRISLDHYTEKIHDGERGVGAFQRTLGQIKWLFDRGFHISIASRSLQNETPTQAKNGHQQLFDQYDISLDLEKNLVIFPEMATNRKLPEISTECWQILKKNPQDLMCASERMVVKRKVDKEPTVMPCTLLAYDQQFLMGKTLKEANQRVYLNHPFCAEFCVLGAGSCSETS